MLILASTSPRRKEIITELELNFEVIDSNYDEVIDHDLEPAQVVLDLALQKGRVVWLQHPDRPILAADTIVAFHNHKVGKAKNREEAKANLQLFSGNRCQIYTGNCFFYNNNLIARTTVAEVEFAHLTDEFIDNYLNDTEADWIDKAGSFAVQGKAASFTTVTGEWSTALGLSKEFVVEMINQFKIL